VKRNTKGEYGSTEGRSTMNLEAPVQIARYSKLYLLHESLKVDRGEKERGV